MLSAQPSLTVDSATDPIGTGHAAESLLNKLLTKVAFLPVVCAVLVFFATFVNTLDIGGVTSSDDPDVGLDATVAIKLALAAVVAMVGFLGLVSSHQVRQSLFGIPGLALVVLGVVFVVTSIFAYEETALVCQAAALIYCAYLCFVPTAISLIGLRTFLYVVIAGLTVHMAMNWFLYLFVPSLGLFEEELWDSILVYRMGGLGHPNSGGRVAALAGVLCLAMMRSRELAPRFRGSHLLLGLIIGLAIATSIACYSRTSILAMVAAALFLFLDRIWSRNGLALIALGVSLLIVGLVGLEVSTGSDFLAEKLLSSTTKTGELQELTTATGRDTIWTEAIRKIAERPLTGWGLNSAPLVLIDFSQHTHNAVLHAALSGGLIAGVLVVFLLSWNLIFGLRSSEPIIRAISVFVLISSLFEDTIIDTFPFPTTVLWLFALLYPSLYAVDETKLAYEQSSQPTPLSL